MILDPRVLVPKAPWISLDNEHTAMVIYLTSLQSWMLAALDTVQLDNFLQLIRTAVPPYIKPTSTLGPLPLTTGPSPQSNGIYKYGKTWENGVQNPESKWKNTSHKSHNWGILANIGHMYHGHCAVVIPPLRRVISLLQRQIGNPTSPSQWCVEIALAFLGSLCHF